MATKWTIWEPEPDAKYPDNIEIGEETGFRVATVWNTMRQDVKQNAAMFINARETLAALKNLFESIKTMEAAMIDGINVQGAMMGYTGCVDMAEVAIMNAEGKS